MSIRCHKCGFVDSGKFCSECGAELVARHPVHRAGKAFFGPFYEYFEYSKSVLQPKVMVENVQSGKLDIYKLASFLVATASLSTLIEYFFPSQALFSNMPPVVGEAITALVLMLLAGLVNSPLHLYFNRGAKGVAFLKFFIATAAITALFYPWLELLNGGLALLGAKDPEKHTNYGTLYFYFQTYSLLYGRSQGSIAVGTVAYMMILTVLAVLFMFAMN